MYDRDTPNPDGLDGNRLAAHRDQMIQAHTRRIAQGLRSPGRVARGKAKPVAGFDVGGRRRWVFPSVTEAARAVGTSRADNISDAIGRGGRCAGLLWGYCDAVPAALKGITADADAGVLRAFLEDARPPRRAGTRPRGRAGAFQNSA